MLLEGWDTAAVFEGDIAHCIRCSAEHRVYARETLWCGQRIRRQIHVFCLTGNLDRRKRNRVGELPCAWPSWFTVRCLSAQRGAWGGKISAESGYPRLRIDPVRKI